ncbi:MAG: glycosyltransferase family 39 protein, partial [Bacteroidales bacterium]
MLKKISEYYKVHPLTCILLAAFLVRLVAVCFAKGYGMHDDHFTIVETARSWVDGYDSENWLPSSQQNPVPGGHSLLYPGLQFLLFEALHLLGIDAAGVTMWVTRFFLAIFSLLTVYFGYKITEKEYGKRIALQAGWTLALFWALPWLSVRNLVEIVCIPFLLWGCWAYLKGDQSKESRPKANLVFWSGFLLGLAFSFRFQTLVFSAGFGL